MKHFELCCSLHTHVCTTRDIEIVSKSHFHDDLHLRVKMENFMLSRNAHKRNSRAHFQHVSWIFSLCTLNYRAKKRLRWSIYTIFLQRKNLVIDVKICMHQKIQIVPSVWALLKSQSETHANIWDLLCCTLLHLLRIANVCDL